MIISTRWFYHEVLKADFSIEHRILRSRVGYLVSYLAFVCISEDSICSSTKAGER